MRMQSSRQLRLNTLPTFTREAAALYARRQVALSSWGIDAHDWLIWWTSDKIKLKAISLNGGQVNVRV